METNKIKKKLLTNINNIDKLLIPKKVISGLFDKKEIVPIGVCELLKLRDNIKLPRIKIIMMIYDHFNSNNLIDGNKILLTKFERNIFKLGKKDLMTLYNLQYYVNKLY